MIFAKILGQFGLVSRSQVKIQSSRFDCGLIVYYKKILFTLIKIVNKLLTTRKGFCGHPYLRTGKLVLLIRSKLRNLVNRILVLIKP